MNVCILTSLEPTNPLIAQCVNECNRLGGEVYVLINELPFRTDNDTLYISFLGDVIIPESLISEHMYNTHPGPPWYRGWGSRLRTIMDKQSIHASTLHKVALPVDSGDIYKTIEFNVYQSDSMDDIHHRAELASLALVTVPSLGVPISRTSPSAMIKSILSVLASVEANTIVEPLTVNESCGACMTPFRETNR